MHVVPVHSVGRAELLQRRAHRQLRSARRRQRKSLPSASVGEADEKDTSATLGHPEIGCVERHPAVVVAQVVEAR